MTRREAREQAFIVLFEKIFDNDSTISEIIATAKEAELIKINSFAENILNIVEEHFSEIDEIIEALKEKGIMVDVSIKDTKPPTRYFKRTKNKIRRNTLGIKLKKRV